jgi:DNA-directed RNA polymerase I, II, and III subunit RPABC2
MQYLDMFGGGKKGRPSDNESEDEQEQEQEQEQDALLRKNTRANAIGTGAPDATSDMESNASTTDDDDDTETSSVANTNTSDEDDDDDEDDDADSLNFDDDLQATPAQQAQALTLTPAMIAKSAASALAANPEVKKKVTKLVAKGNTTLQQSYDDLEVNDDDDDVDDSDGDDAEDADDGTNYLRKFDSEMRENYITAHHHEMMQLNAAEVDALARVVRNVDGMIVDSMHQTMPFLTKYEKTRVLGQRAKQLNQGAQPLIPVDKKIIDGYLIAQLELQQKALPFIIRRPLPGGKSEYWRLADLELI